MLHVNLSPSKFWEKVNALFFISDSIPLLRHTSGVDGDGKMNAGLFELEHPQRVMFVFTAELSSLEYQNLHFYRALWN